MDLRLLFRSAAVAALAAFVCVLVMGFGAVAPEGVQLQPSYPPAPAEEFARASNEVPEVALRYFAADSLFVLSYLMVFAGLYGLTAGRARPLAVVGLAAGGLAAFFDTAENAFFISYAMLAQSGAPLVEPDVPLVFILANLKWAAAFATLYAFGLAFPRGDGLGWAISALMLLFPVVGTLGVALPELAALRGLFFLIGMPLFAFYFWRQAGRAAGGDMAAGRS
jgi:hypothetical protein